MTETPPVLERATLTARHEALQAELLEAMRIVERYRGALALLDELLALPDAEPPREHVRGLEVVA